MTIERTVLWWVVVGVGLGACGQRDAGESVQTSCAPSDLEPLTRTAAACSQTLEDFCSGPSVRLLVDGQPATVDSFVEPGMTGAVFPGPRGVRGEMAVIAGTDSTLLGGVEVEIGTLTTEWPLGVRLDLTALFVKATLSDSVTYGNVEIEYETDYFPSISGAPPAAEGGPQGIAGWIEVWAEGAQPPVEPPAPFPDYRVKLCFNAIKEAAPAAGGPNGEQTGTHSAITFYVPDLRVQETR